MPVNASLWVGVANIGVIEVPNYIAWFSIIGEHFVKTIKVGIYDR
jgi:hypothetical protein